MRKDGRLEFAHDAGPLFEAECLYSALNPELKEHLHADANAENRATPGKPAFDDLVAAVRAQRIHHCGKGTNTGHQQSVGFGAVLLVARQYRVCTGCFNGLHGRVNVACSVVEDDDGLGHRAPLVLGMPCT